MPLSSQVYSAVLGMMRKIKNIQAQAAIFSFRYICANSISINEYSACALERMWTKSQWNLMLYLIGKKKDLHHKFSFQHTVLRGCK